MRSVAWIATLSAKARAAAWTSCLAAGLLAVAPHALSAEEPVKPEKPEKKEEPKGPDHSVSLAEETGVNDLFNRAAKARARAEKDPQAWPECVRYYADILRKYPDSVYLHAWEGADKKNMAFKNGVYRSTRERVAKEIASLPPEGLALYRVINDPVAGALLSDGRAQYDERKVGQVISEFYSTSQGDDAAAWLGEFAYDRGDDRRAVAALSVLPAHPDRSVNLVAGLARTLLAQLKVNDRDGGGKTYDLIVEALKDEKNGTLRVGHDEGPAALAKLKSRIEALKGGTVAQQQRTDAGWTTYFGNASHTKFAAPRRQVGVKKWEVPVARLLYGPNSDAEGERAQNDEGQVVSVPTLNYHLTADDGFFYICDGQVVAGYPVNNPKPGLPAASGNARMLWPADAQKVTVDRNQRNYGNQGLAVRHHPYFTTIDKSRVYAVLGFDGSANRQQFRRWQNNGEKIPGNYLVALNRQTRGAGTDADILWSLQPDTDAFKKQSKDDQEWLKEAFFVSAPTLDSDTLYAMAIQGGGGTNDAFVVALDAPTGRILWRTRICAAAQVYMYGLVQPDLGLPIAVSQGSVYCVTNHGAVAALDAAAGRIKWIRVYDRVRINTDRFNRVEVAGSEFWAPNPPIVHENLVIATPQDSNLMYAFDIETGKRVWEISRENVEFGSEKKVLRHILGIRNGILVATGTEVQFYQAKNGKRVEPLNLAPKSPIKGRGVLTDSMALVPTESSLLRIEMNWDKENNNAFKAKVLDEVPWTDAKKEAGNIFIAGDVLYTISHTHVNAFFVLEEVEARLKERLARNDRDTSAFVELADIYHRVERYEEALKQLDTAEALAVGEKGPQQKEQLIEIRSRKFDSRMAMGDRDRKSQKPAEAYANYQTAYEIGNQPGLPVEYPVMALRSMADIAQARNDIKTTVRHLQELIAKHGNVVYAFHERTSSKARLYAQSRIAEIAIKHPAAFEEIEIEAKAALEKAGDDIAKLEKLLSDYPNAAAGGVAMRRLAEFHLEKNPERARQFGERFLGRYSGSPDAPAIFALLVVSMEKLQLNGEAKDLLRRLATRKDFAEVTAVLDRIDQPETGGKEAKKIAGGEPVKIAAWAAERLKGARYQRSPSQATTSLGSGNLKLSWTKSAGDKWTPFSISGRAPREAAGALFFLENETDLVALSARDGDEMWKPRPKMPGPLAQMLPNWGADFNPTYKAVWLQTLLVLCGGKELVALDSRDNGNVVWRYTLIGGANGASPYWVQPCGSRLAVMYTGGVMCILDAASGSELWRTQLEGTQMFGLPAHGDGFIAVGMQNPAKVFIFDLETGALRARDPIGSGGYSVPLLAKGDRLFVAERNNRIRAYDGFTGKLVWEGDAGGQVSLMKATTDLLVAVVNKKDVSAFNIDPQKTRKAWGAVLPPGAMAEDVAIDGDDLYVAAKLDGGNQERTGTYGLLAYSIPKEGMFRWRQPLYIDGTAKAMAEQRALQIQQQQQDIFVLDQEPFPLLGPDQIAREHIVALQSNWDPSNAMPWAVVLVDRRNGKLVWDQTIRGEGRNVVNQQIRVRLFDGGFVLNDARNQSAYVAFEGLATPENIQALKEKLAKSPDDVTLKLRLIHLQYEKGDRDASIAELAALLADAKLEDAKFGEAYTLFTRLRKENAAKKKMAIPFTKVAAAPKMDGDQAAWEAIPAITLDSWSHVFLRAEDDERADPKKNKWKGPDDLKVVFKGAYDDTNLYLSFVVTDDAQKNDQTEPRYCDLGDSVKVAFDIDQDGGVGYRGEDYEVGVALDKNGKTVGWRWVEKGRYLRGETPLASPIFASRQENEKRTVYQMTIPLASIGLKGEAGRKFGFTFSVNDVDGGSPAGKWMGASPMRPPEPGRFGEGVLK